MSAAPGDRPIKKSIIKMLRAAVADGKFHTATWAVIYCKENDTWYRANGKHTSTVLSDVNSSVAGIKVSVVSYDVDTLTEVAEICKRYDPMVSSRCTADVIRYYVAAVESLKNVPQPLITRCVNGLAIAKHGYEKYTQDDIGVRAEECVFGKTAFIHFVHHLCDKSAMFTNAPIVSVICETYDDSPRLAKTFWTAVKDGTGTNPESPDRELQRYLLSHKIKSGKKAVDPKVLISKARKLWGRWKAENATPDNLNLGDLDTSNPDALNPAVSLVKTVEIIPEAPVTANV